MVKIPKLIKKTFENYSSEAKSELEELSKHKIESYNSSITEKKIYLTLAKTGAKEVIVYDLSNFSVNTYSDFNKKIKELYFR